MADEISKVDIGFHGGQVLSVRLLSGVYEDLRKALANERSDRWFELKTQDSEVSIDLSRVEYVRLDTDVHRVGF